MWLFLFTAALLVVFLWVLTRVVALARFFLDLLLALALVGVGFLAEAGICGLTNGLLPSSMGGIAGGSTSLWAQAGCRQRRNIPATA
ncbi:MAG: hypothetical protein P8168_03960 [Deltaproteobacteria bacterium]